MLQIYDVETAGRTILRRRGLLDDAFPSSVLRRTAELFGEWVTPSQAVATILVSVRNEGDAALRRWSRVLDKAKPENLVISAAALEVAFESLPEALKAAMLVAAERIRRFHGFQPLPNWQIPTSWVASLASG